MNTLLPRAPRFSLAVIGPGIVLIAMGLGSGEFVLWPNLVAEFGFGVLLGAVIGITLQFVISSESMRYTIATGGSIYEAFARLHRALPFWFIFSTYISFAWPGIILSGGTVFAYLFDIQDARIVTVLLLLLIGAMLTLGGSVYATIERIQKIIIAFSLPILMLIAIAVTQSGDMQAFFEGLIGFGDGYWFFPSGVSLLGFLGAIAYSGAGGNLVLSQSIYVQDEGHGAAKTANSEITKGGVLHPSQPFNDTPENTQRFKQWFRLLSLEQFISFWFVGLVIIGLLAIIAYSLLYPIDTAGDLQFIFLQAEILARDTGDILGTLFLLIGGLFLFKTQLGLYETTSRGILENIHLMWPTTKRFTRRTLFLCALWLQVLSAIVLTLLVKEPPFVILIIGTFFSAVSMFALSGIMLITNNSEKILPKSIHPGRIRNIIMYLSFIGYGIFVGVTIVDIIR